MFHALLQDKATIEQECGLSFDWRELPERKASRIVLEKSVSLSDRSQWSEQFDWLIDVMLKMKAVFKKYIWRGDEMFWFIVRCGNLYGAASIWWPERSEYKSWKIRVHEAYGTHRCWKYRNSYSVTMNTASLWGRCKSAHGVRVHRYVRLGASLDCIKISGKTDV